MEPTWMGSSVCIINFEIRKYPRAWEEPRNGAGVPPRSTSFKVEFPIEPAETHGAGTRGGPSTIRVLSATRRRGGSTRPRPRPLARADHGGASRSSVPRRGTRDGSSSRRPDRGRPRASPRFDPRGGGSRRRSRRTGGSTTSVRSSTREWRTGRRRCATRSASRGRGRTQGACRSSPGGLNRRARAGNRTGRETSRRAATPARVRSRGGRAGTRTPDTRPRHDPSATTFKSTRTFAMVRDGAERCRLVGFQFRRGERLSGTRPERLVAQTEVPEGCRPRNDPPHHPCEPSPSRDGRAGSRRMPESRSESPRPDLRGDGGGRVLVGLLRPLQSAVRAGLRPRDTLSRFRPEDPGVQRPPIPSRPPGVEGPRGPRGRDPIVEHRSAAAGRGFLDFRGFVRGAPRARRIAIRRRELLVHPRPVRRGGTLLPYDSRGARPTDAPDGLGRAGARRLRQGVEFRSARGRDGSEAGGLPPLRLDANTRDVRRVPRDL